MKMVPAPPPTVSSPMMSSNNHQQFEVTEDTPVDFLEGCMEILVIFPNEKSILMSIQRRMPMLDLLIHVTAANKISPAAHLLQVTDEEGRFLPHKPSTPIGSLNAHKVYIVSKNRLMSDRSGRSGNTKSSSTASSQFEQSFRVQVRLPRNQLFVTRVTGRTQLADLLHTVCNEKALDPRHYELRHPVNLDERLRLSSCLDDYKLQEVVLVPLGGKNPQTAVLSVHDLTTMNKKTAAVTVSNSSSNMPGSSKMSGGKSTLRPTSSEATLAHAGHEKKKRGLFGLLGFGKSKKGSSMGDSSVSSDSAGDRSISPSRSEEPAPPAEPVAPSPPSPVLFSKRLAEEAVAKRNSRLMMSQMSSEPTTPTTTTTNASATAPSPLRNGMAPAKPAAKKKRAPAPPPPSSSTPPPGMNGPPPKAASEISSYSTSSSGSNAVSPSTSVIHHSETEMVHSPSPKLSYNRQESNLARRQPDSGSSSPMRPSSNLLTTPDVSSSNLTQVSSTSNASLASAIKKRKAPVPPPALDEQVEASEKTTTVVVVNGSHDDSDQASSVSDQMSSVSDISSPRKSATPEVVEQPVVVERHHHQQPSPVVAPIPAARTRIPPVSSTPSSRHQGSECSSRKSSSSSGELALDEQSLNMFSSRNELDQMAEARRAAMAAQQLELESRQRAEAEHLKMVQEQQRQAMEAERKRMEETLAREKVQLQQTILVEQRKTASPPEVIEQPKRKKWNRHPEIQLDLLAATRSESGDSSDDEAASSTRASSRGLKAPSGASRASSVSEFFSLSEDESDSPIQQAVSSKFREEDEEEEEDPDVAFVAMCTALARRKQIGEIELPADLSLVPMETLQSDEKEAETDRSSWRRSSSEPGWIAEKSLEASTSPPQSPTSRSARRSSSFNDGQRRKSTDVPADPLLLFPPLSNSSFSAVLSSRGEYEDIPLLLINHNADGRSSRHPHPGLDSPRSSAASTSTKASSEDDYEVLNYQREVAENVENKTQSSLSSYNQAQESEEVVVSEPIYTMVIKSPKIMKAVDWEPKGTTEPAGSDQSDRTNGEAPVEAEPVAEPVTEQADKIEVVTGNGVMEEEEPVMERDAGDGQTESPVMWEYKLPAPPTPFQDSRESPLDKLQIQASASETNRSRHSSMSTDSLQHGSGDDDGEEIYQKDSLRSSIVCPETPEVKEDDNQVAIKLEHGVELLEETRTEEQPMDVSVIAEAEKEVVSKAAEEEKVVVVLKSSDPQAKQYGIESTTDEPLPTLQQEVSLPPVPSTLPPSDSEDDSLQTEMRFSIATYNLRVSKDSSYEKKLRSISPEPAPANLTTSLIDPEKEVNDPVVPIVAEIKEPETVVEPVKVQVSGSAAVAATTQPSLPMINADFIQQFQNALHCIDDPKARTLQEEFLRLQQQLLSLQMQAAVQQNSSPAVSDPVATKTEDTTDRSPETIKIEEEVVVADVSKSVSVDLHTEVVVEAERIELAESPAEIPLQQQQKEEPNEPVVYRYTGPPQVKLDTWKPGRPRSEVIDYSRSSSFNVPLAAAVEKKSGEMPTTGTVSAVAATDVISSIPEEVAVRASPIPEEESKIKSVIIADVEEMDVREKIEHIESSSPTSPSPKPVVLRKSSFLTARPFEARPVSMPIKRPSFTPMVIQPVPFVSRKIRAPEVRGFASLPPVTNENPLIRMAGPMVAPFSAVNKPRTVATVSKENPTIVIRNKLIESARRPSAELNGAPIKLIEEYSNQENTTTEVGKESSVIVAETRRNSSSSRPLSMPVSSSLLLAAGAGGAVNKTQPIIPEIPNPPVPPPPSAQQSVVSGADPASTAAGRRSLSSKFVRKVDPREELLNSIRSFANGGALRKTGASLDK